jgi:F-type H+-transporting ATPase subunit epsilon
MAGTLKFELVSPERILLSEDASEVIVPGMDGQFTVLPGHAPLISTLRPGVLVAKLTSGTRRVFVRGGFAEVEPDRLTILAQHLIDIESVDRSAIDAELKVAEAALGEAKDDLQRMMAQDAIEHLSSLGSKAA